MENNVSAAVNILDLFDGITNKPETFVSTQEDVGNKVRNLLKQTYDVTKLEESKLSKSDALPELIIQNFDLEQIWQQIELQNNHALKKSVTLVSKLVVTKDKLLFNYGQNEDLADNGNLTDDDNSLSDHSDLDDKNNSNNNTDSELQENEEAEISDNENDESDHKDSGKPKIKFRPSVVDDEFFKLDEMNNFLETEEKKLNKTKITAGSDSESDESIDMFQGNSENENDDEDDFEGNDKLNNPRYKDFFETKTQQRIEMENKMLEDDDDKTDEDRSNEEIDDDNDNEDETNTDKNNYKSTLELREERLKMKIMELEDAAVSEKPWQLKGEVTAESRPQNSLLEEVLEFDLTSRPAPVITEVTTLILEDVIRQRIKDKAFDDVQRKEKPVETPLEYKKKLMLDQEKSKESLAQIYEKEFIEQREALHPDEGEKQEEEPQLHKEIKTMMHSLFTKLDALSNFHFTPKPAAPELRVVSNLPAVNMEEVAPVAASDAALLAPEEIKSKTKGDIIGKGERTDTDKNRERRKKKQKQREHAKEKKKKENMVNKLRPGLGNKYSKEKAKKMLDRMAKDANVDKMDESFGAKSVKSSTAFFTQLQDEVTSHIKNKTKPKRKTKKHLDAKKMKL